MRRQWGIKGAVELLCMIKKKNEDSVEQMVLKTGKKSPDTVERYMYN